MLKTIVVKCRSKGKRCIMDASLIVIYCVRLCFLFSLINFCRTLSEQVRRMFCLILIALFLFCFSFRVGSSWNTIRRYRSSGRRNRLDTWRWVELCNFTISDFMLQFSLETSWCSSWAAQQGKYYECSRWHHQHWSADSLAWHGRH